MNLIYNKTQNIVTVSTGSFNEDEPVSLSLRTPNDELITTIQIPLIDYCKMMESTTMLMGESILYGTMESGMPINAFSDDVKEMIKTRTKTYCKLQTNDDRFYRYEYVVSVNKDNQLYCLGVKPEDTNYQPTSPFIYSFSFNSGDIDGNLELNVDDIKTMQNYLHGKSTLKGTQLLRGDMNKDGVVNVFDLVLLKRRVTNQNS